MSNVVTGLERVRADFFEPQPQVNLDDARKIVFVSNASTIAKIMALESFREVFHNDIRHMVEAWYLGDRISGLIHTLRSNSLVAPY